MPRRFVVRVPAQVAFLVHIDADIDQDLPVLEHVRRHHLRLSCRSDDELGPPDLPGHILCPRMADRHGRIAPKQHHRDRFADHQAPADDRGAHARRVDPVMIEHRHAGFRCARRIPAGCIGKDARKRGIRDAVHVLFGAQRIAHRPVVDLHRERPQKKRPVHGRVFVDLPDHRQQFLLRCRARQHILPDRDADRLRAFHRAALIRDIARFLSKADDRKTRPDAVRKKRRRACRERCVERRRHFFSG